MLAMQTHSQSALPRVTLVVIVERNGLTGAVCDHELALLARLLVRLVFQDRQKMLYALPYSPCLNAI